jgi:hypothetical protein
MAIDMQAILARQATVTHDRKYLDKNCFLLIYLIHGRMYSVGENKKISGKTFLNLSSLKRHFLCTSVLKRETPADLDPPLLL